MPSNWSTLFNTSSRSFIDEDFSRTNFYYSTWKNNNDSTWTNNNDSKIASSTFPLLQREPSTCRWTIPSTSITLSLSLSSEKVIASSLFLPQTHYWMLAVLIHLQSYYYINLLRDQLFAGTPTILIIQGSNVILQQT
jgi:hypothetical protein